MSPLFRQRGRARRVSPDKTQPPDELTNRAGALRIRTFIPAILMGLLFAVLVVVTVVSGHPPLKFYPGDVAPADVRARVTFRFIDEEATKRAREQARMRTPNVYAADDGPLVESENALVGLLDELRAATDPRAKLAEIAGGLPIPETELTVLVADLMRPKTSSTVRVALRELFAELASTGIMSDERKRDELKAIPSEITVVSKSAGEGSVRELRAVHSLTEAARRIDDVLAGKLGAGLTGTASALQRWLKTRLKPTLTYDEAASAAARSHAEQRVRDVSVEKKPGELLVEQGKHIWKREYDMLQAEQAGFLSSQDPVERWKRIAGVSILAGLGFVLGGLYLKHYRPRVLRSRIRMTVLGLLVIVMVVTAKLLLNSPRVPHPLYWVPVGFASMILAMAYDRRFAFGMTLFIVAMVGLATEADFRPLMVLLAGGSVAALYTVDIRKRTKLLKVGVLIGLAQVVTIYGVGLGQLHGPGALSQQAAVGMINGVLVGFLITGLLPFLEPLFRITTDISLLELGDLNQPILKSFALRAPGSYNHSLSVAALAEAAARAIGADDLLVRVGSYFHDIGKINKPQYFVENQGDQGNPHDKLSPQMSALVIIAHAKDGLELGRELGLPRPILEIIAEHHGTTLVEYFYKRASEAAAGDDGSPEEHLFRYPGPNPRSREAAIVMLADSVESASRTLSDPTPGAVGNLVRRITQAKLADGQLGECALTLAELHGIEQSLAKGLNSIFHGRIKY